MAHQPGHPGYEETIEGVFNPAKKKKGPNTPGGMPPSGPAAPVAPAAPVPVIPAKPITDPGIPPSGLAPPPPPITDPGIPPSGLAPPPPPITDPGIPPSGLAAPAPAAPAAPVPIIPTPAPTSTAPYMRQPAPATPTRPIADPGIPPSGLAPQPTPNDGIPELEGFPEPPDQSWEGQGPGKYVMILNPRDPLGGRIRLWQPEGWHYQWYWNGPQGRFDYKLVPINTTVEQPDETGSHTTGVPADQPPPPQPEVLESYQPKEFDYSDQPLEDARASVDGAKAQFDAAVAEFAKASGRVYEVRWNTAEDGFDYPTVWYQDVGGTWTQDKSMNFKRAFEALDSVYKRVQNSPQDFQEWLNRNPDYGSYRDIGALSEKAAKLQEQWEQDSMGEESFHEAARILGFDSARDMQQFLQDERANLPKNVDESKGLGEAERTVMDRAHWTAMSEMREQMERDIDAIAGETGSTMRAFQAADGYRRQVTSANLNYRMSVFSMDFMRRQANFDSAAQRYELMVSQGIMAQEQATLAIVQDRASQLQAFAMEIGAAQAGNAQLMAVSAHDQQMLDNYVSQMTNIINMDLGMQVAVREGMDDAYNRHVKPYMDRVGVHLTKLQQDFSRYELEVSRHLEFSRMDHETQENAKDRILARYIADSADGGGGGGGIGEAIGTAAYVVCKIAGICP